MMKRLMFCLMAMMGVLTMTAQSSVYDFTVKDDGGKDVSLAEYKGKVLLIVNTATRCGFTPQYKDLEPLYQKYKGQGFEILDFPCNQFGQQAPGTIQEIHQFCTANFDIHFPQFDKIDVNGEKAHPLYTWLKAQAGGGELDAGLLGENMMLAAQSLGLGTCCLGGPVRFLLSNEKCKFFFDRLDIPADYKLNYILAIGYPDEQPAAKPRDASKVKYIK